MCDTNVVHRIDDILTHSPLPPLDSRILLSHILKKDVSFLTAHAENSLSEEEYMHWIEYKNRATRGEPIAYIMNHKEFYGLDFYVDSRVLIPRPESEELVDLAVTFISKTNTLTPISILEIATGSGAIIISLAKELTKRYPKKKLSFTATDISRDALNVARKNAEIHGVLDKISFFEGDLFVPVENSSFEIILANLPYLPRDEALTNRFEPQIALDGGKDGTDIIKQLISEYRNHLNPDGILVYETYAGKVIQTPGLPAGKAGV